MDQSCHSRTDGSLEMKMFRFAETGLVEGGFVHVFVDPRTEKPVHISHKWRSKLDLLTNQY